MPSPSARAAPVLSLKQFMTRGQVLALYRDILRCTKFVAPSDRAYIREWARSDIERYRHETSDDKIRMLISQGKVQLRTLENSVALSRRRFDADAGGDTFSSA
ncbi:LYR motif-containing protein 2 [Polyrhizophydium stewartii]|uniref:LYR motif-containing protein 2 n=1 Tax=Polyrhizophydium stewartii TaxID=2732419 RepID=A0ABR4N7W1_9FUNG